MLKPWKMIASGHEDLFLERYERLLVCALRLSGQDRGLARDLVHDAFIQFTFTRPDLGAIDNLDGYLYGVLRHLHLSYLRRATRHVFQPLSVIEYDSAAVGLRALDAAAQAQIHDALRHVCSYACARKQSSKAGGVLILRFFHGYYPSEIARIILASRQVVDERLRVARAEAKLYLENPTRLAFMKENDPKIGRPDSGAPATGGLLQELRRAVFQARTGDCFTPERLRELYRSPDKVDGASLDCERLAHLVSCPSCLDEVNRLLGLPPLSERYPTDMIGPDTTGPAGRGGSPPQRGATPDEVNAMRCRAREVFEHQPRRLAVSINGRLVAAQRLGAEVNEQTLRLDEREPVDFVELFSEQQIRLLLFSVAPPPQGASQQEARVELSDGRVLEAALSFGGDRPTLRVVYTNPLSQVAAESGDLGIVGREWEAGSGDSSAIPEPQVPESAPPRSSLPTSRSPLWRWLARPRLWLSPATATAIVMAALIAAWVLMRTHTPAVSAAELLRRSAEAEAAMAGQVDVTLHRQLTLEERRAPSGELLARRRIEIWQSAERKIKARRLYDEKDQLIAGEWVRDDGSRTLYRRGAAPQELPAPASGVTPAQSPPLLLDTSEVWRLELAARDFATLIGSAAAEETGEAYLINYANESAGGAGLLKATLTLAKPGLRAVAQTLLVARGGEVRQYLFRESGFAQVQTRTVAPSVFQPDPPLLGAAEKRRGEDEVAQVQTAPPPPPAVAPAELEVEVAYLLNQIKANLGDDVRLTRTAAGALRVEALVETDRRKQEILRVLAPVIGHSAVGVEVSTVAEALRRRKPPGGAGVVVREVEVTGGTIPADADLRRYFSARLTDRERIDEEISRFARRMMSRSRQALLHASALKGLVERFSPEAIRALEPAAQAKWRAMIAEHAQACQREVRLLGQELQPVFFPAAPPAGGEEAKTSDGLTPVQAARRLLQLSYTHDEMTRAAFAISEESRAGDSLKAPQSRRSLLAAERLAAAIEEFYQP
jgi:DNA-directed RNA polymerase specialized sigma24 family protein